MVKRQYYYRSGDGKWDLEKLNPPENSLPKWVAAMFASDSTTVEVAAKTESGLTRKWWWEKVPDPEPAPKTYTEPVAPEGSMTGTLDGWSARYEPHLWATTVAVTLTITDRDTMLDGGSGKGPTPGSKVTVSWW